jgi:hypothetical protein
LENQLKWLERDELLYNFCESICKIHKFDKQLFSSICEHMDKFSKLYYREIEKSDANIYSNLYKHKQTIVKLEDIREDVCQMLHDVVYVIPYKRFMLKLDIPSKLDFIKNVFDHRIDLLMKKRKLYSESST